jgi:hypothetical protein
VKRDMQVRIHFLVEPGDSVPARDWTRYWTTSISFTPSRCSPCELLFGILSSTSRSPKLSFPFRFLYWNFLCISYLPMHAMYPRLFRNSSHYASFSYCAFFSAILQFMFTLLEWVTKFHTHTTTIN